MTRKCFNSKHAAGATIGSRRVLFEVSTLVYGGRSCYTLLPVR